MNESFLESDASETFERFMAMSAEDLARYTMWYLNNHVVSQDHAERMVRLCEVMGGGQRG